MKRIKKLFQITPIDVFIYRMNVYTDLNIPNFKFHIKKSRLKNKWCYIIKEGEKIIHISYLYEKVHLLKLLAKKGPVIGDCFTNKDYRGQSIYPKVINWIAADVLGDGTADIFIIVNKDNKSSIRGVEKSGFIRYAEVKARRWLWFYFRKNVKQY